MDSKPNLKHENSLLTRSIVAESHQIKINARSQEKMELLLSKIQEETSKAKADVKKLDRSIEAFFIGPRGENIEYFHYLIKKAIDSHLAARVEYELQDSRHITRKMKNEGSFLDAQDRLDRALNLILTKMKDLAPPFYSSRYFGHMNWENTIPAIVGNFATLLYNPNNCAFEASPFTTLIQIETMKEFAKAFGLPPFLSFGQKKKNSGVNYSWGHLTCGGTVANCEAFWAARNCKFLALSVRKYIEKIQNTNNIKQIKVFLANGTEKKLLDLTAWELLNISNQSTMELYDNAYKILYPGQNDNETNFKAYQNGVGQHAVGKAGLIDMYEWLNEINDLNPEPVWINKRVPKVKVFVSSTGHYSIKKSISILGLGQGYIQKLYVDCDSRISTVHLKAKLQECLDKKIPVLSVVGIVGTTEESTVDNISEIFNFKQYFASQGLYFHLHIDGAYGGYFASMIREKQPSHWNSYSNYVQKQLHMFQHADSITFDPHKTGYVPYACGGIIYRNHRLRDNLSFSAAYIYTGAEPNMSIYGVEGSKPGSSVASVYLSLQVLPLVRGGHGQLLERTLINTKIFTASLYRIKEIQVQYGYDGGKLQEKFDCLLLTRLHWQKENKPDLKETQMRAIKLISQSSPQNLQQRVKAGQNGESYQPYYLDLGPDLNIVCYSLNFRDKETNRMNKSLKKLNEFNRALINLSKPVGSDISVRMKDLYVSQTQVTEDSYGREIFQDFLQRHNLERDGENELVLIRSTIMNAFFTEITNQDSRIEFSNRIFLRELLENGCETLLHLKWR